jgi:membrane protein YdbS with pleckstrin-like domain
MDFTNDAFDISLLPKAEDVPFIPIERPYLTVIRIEWSITSAILLIICIVLLFSIRGLQQPVWIALIGGGWILMTAFYFFAQQKSFFAKAYALRDKDLLYRSGWIVQKIRTCPFNRIQHSSVNTGFFERKYGLATLVLFTAGTDDADLQIPGLKEADAYAMKEWITQKIIHEEQSGT